MRIRRLNPGEGMLYKKARLASLKDSPEAFSSSYADAVERSDESWHMQADASAAGRDRATFIALDETPVGLAAIYRDESEPDVGELIQMWIAPEKRGSALANDLLDALFEWAASSGFSRVRAEVVSQNSRALRFYEKYGFVRSADPGNCSMPSVVLLMPVES
ncbi:MAG: GNAT family N-acetyltransferase [Luteolibacter sp.]